MIIPTLKIDTRRFAQTIQKAVRESSRAAPDVVNQMAYDVAVGAAHGTKVADKNKIAWTLGQTGQALNYTKKGDRLRKGKGARGRMIVKSNADSLAARIVNQRRRDYAGHDYMLWGNALEDAAVKLIKARQAAVGFIASGFVRAARHLRQFARFKLRETPKGIKVTPDGPGGKGIPCRDTGGIFGSGKFVAYVSNDVVTGGGRFQAKGKTFNPGPIAEAGFNKGFEATRERLEQKIKKRLEEAMKKAGAM